MRISTASRIAGCLLGGAVGDALGAPVEFMGLETIRRRYGGDGVNGYVDTAPTARFTDDTQMTLFTADALIRADNRFKEKGICNPTAVAHRAYLRWLHTQVGHAPYEQPEGAKSWLLGIPELRERRAPGSTCLSALMTGKLGSPEEPLNNSKGCGGVMRVAPIGLAAQPEQAFQMGVEWAAITHGHPSGYLAAGVLACVIAVIGRGGTLQVAVARARDLLSQRSHASETLAAVDGALAAFESGTPSAEIVETLGQGWIAEEALAIAVYCALVARDFRHGVLLAVNHSGDSDSTGAITGNVLGTLLGREAIPAEWLEPLELHATLEDIAHDMWRHFGADRYVPLGPVANVPVLHALNENGTETPIYDDHDPSDWAKYPGY